MSDVSYAKHRAASLTSSPEISSHDTARQSDHGVHQEVGPPETQDVLTDPMDADTSSGSGEAQDPYPENSEAFYQPSLGSRVRDLLHLPHQLPEGYTYDLHPRPIVPSLDDYQQGYGKVAAFENCDPGLAIYRKFGWLRHRTLLSLQDQLAELESMLQRLDRHDFTDGDELNLVSQRRDYGPVGMPRKSDRRAIMERIQSLLKEYDELLLQTRKVMSLKRPSKRAQQGLFCLIKNTGSIVKKESEWIRHSTDLAALACGTEHGWFNDAVEDFMNGISMRLSKLLFSGREERLLAGKEVIHLTSPTRRDYFLRFVLTLLALILLLVPVFILFKLQPSKQSEVRQKSNYQILTIFLFTLLFSASCSIFTRARRHEVFSATAAYCAVLVIFLGNTSNVVVATNGLLAQ